MGRRKRCACATISTWKCAAPPPPRAEQTAAGWALRFAPGDVARTSWPRPLSPSGAGKFAATGSGWIEFDVALPPEVDTSALRGLRLRCEAGARAGLAKVEWPERLNGVNYPQTEPDCPYPTRVIVSLNGVPVGELALPDDPADARGVLSHLRDIDPGSYGYLCEMHVEGEELAQVLAEDSTVLRVRFTVPPAAQPRRAHLRRRPHQ